MNIAELDATNTYFLSPQVAPTAEESAARAAQSKRDRDTAQWLRLCPNGSAISNPVMRGLVIHHANCLARAAGAGAATLITIADKDEVLKRLPSGNRKKSDGSYVSNAYMKKGWSSTFSQHSVCEVSIDAHTLLLA